MQRYEELREYFSHVREAFGVDVVKFGEQRVKQGEMPVGNWRAYLNALLACDACAVSCVVCFVGSKPWDAL